MSNLVKCPFCSVEIEDDSFYCDQCGKELMICPTCRTFGKGKFCTKDRTPLVLASTLPAGGSGTAPATNPQSAAQPVQPVQAAKPQAPAQQPVQQPVSQPQPAAQAASQSTMKPQGAAPQLPTKLICASARIILNLKEGATIGRRNGEYASQFQNQPYVSGTHARIGKGAQWTITDLGSTNGTFINGVQLQANVAAPFGKGDTVRIATLDFTVE